MSATEILERLRRANPADPPFLKRGVEAAVCRHLAALGFEPPTLHWAPSIGAAIDRATGRSWDREWLIEEADAWYAARVALGCERDRDWEDGTTATDVLLRREAERAAWRREDQEALVDRRPDPPPDETGMTVQLGRWNANLWTSGGRILKSSWKPGTRTGTLAGRLKGDGGAENRATRLEPWRPSHFEHVSGARAAGEAIVWIAAASRLQDIPRPVQRMIEIWSPLLEAFEAGLWAYFIFPDETILVPRPAVRMRGNRLHAEKGPAIAWPEGPDFWFWNGVHVPRHVVEEPNRITAKDILAEQNAEVRRVLLERFGPQRYLVEIGATPVHQDEYGTLYRVEMTLDEPLVMVKVLNSTPEPDGTRKEYFLRVPPTMTTARQAVAWTFGLDAGQYRPSRET